MTVFTTVTKKKLSWPTPTTATTSTSRYYLNIGNGFKLLIADGYKLVIQPGGRRPQNWTTRTKYT